MQHVTDRHPRQRRLLQGFALEGDDGSAQAERTGDVRVGDEFSHLKRYDHRLEDWLGALEDEAGQRYWLAALEAEAGQRSHEVLGALAARARDVAERLERMAERARSQGEPAPPEPSAHLLHLKPRGRAARRVRAV
jgi:hypothetical protein